MVSFTGNAGYLLADFYGVFRHRKHPFVLGSAIPRDLLLHKHVLVENSIFLFTECVLQYPELSRQVWLLLLAQDLDMESRSYGCHH